jgi:nucleoid DNA-binding protein
MKQFDMKREDLARVLAERSQLTQGEAQDELDRLVHGIVRSLRRGRVAEMPGIGRLTATRPEQRRVGSSPTPGSLKRRNPKQ